MSDATMHLAVYDTLADWEIGYLTAHVNRPAWHREPGRWSVRTVAATAEPITTMGGLRVTPDLVLAELRPEDSAALVLPGNDIWAGEAFVPFAAKAREFLDAGRTVGAICGATGGLALAGLLDDRDHTSNAAAFLDSLGYGGAARYRDEPVVVDRGLVTASANAPVHFARALLEQLGVFAPETAASWAKFYGDRDPAGFYELVGS